MKTSLPACVAIALLASCASHKPFVTDLGGANVSALDLKAFADGKTDATAAIQEAIDHTGLTGGEVFLPPGKYLVAGNIKLAKGVSLRGANNMPMDNTALLGTVILATAGRDQEDGPPLFHLGNARAVIGLTVFYPEQKIHDIHAYPWTFQLEGTDNTVENVTLINSYQGLRTGPEVNHRHRVRSLYGCVLRRGIFIDNCWDIGRVENCQLHCHWWTQPELGGDQKAVFNYMVEHCEAFTFGRTDWEYVTNNFVFPAKVGFRFIHTKNGECNGHITACGADACETSVQVDAIQPMGLLITGGEFVAFTGRDPVEVRIANTCTGSVRFVNCAFWGPSLHNAVIDSAGYTSFSDCYFSSQNRKAPDEPLIVANSGRLQIHNSTFATTQPSVRLGPNVKHAIIESNNGKAGVRIEDQTSGRAIIRDNEPSPP